MINLDPVEKANPSSPLTLTEFKKVIPKHCFEKSLPRSLIYMFRNLILLSTSIYTYPYFAASWPGLFLYWNIYGFLMWCLFVVGHDCGHNSFSKYPIINAICGHICHAPLLVPFFPWAYSHRKHHQFHNHIDKDNSHPWLDENKITKFNKHFVRNIFTPFFAFGFYLYSGFNDGSHINPVGKLFRDADKREKIKCAISAITIVGFLTLLYVSFDSWSQLMLFYVGPWIIFCFWLFMVTYMQHHDEDTILYDDSSWDFVSGALQTVDRKYGFKIDKFHHHISDCHLVHHLFFTQIPHYHLEEATKAIIPILGEKYKIKTHKTIIRDFWKHFFKFNFTKWTLKSKSDSKNSSE